MESSVSEWLGSFSDRVRAAGRVDSSLYEKYDVKRGLRDISGKGVLAGLTTIGEVQAHAPGDDPAHPGPGRLIYRGLDINDLVQGFWNEERNGFEEAAFLLLFGELPNSAELAEFQSRLSEFRMLPDSFVHDAILKLASPNLMNAMTRGILALYVSDDRAEDLDLSNVLRQSLSLMAVFPLLAAYSYQASAYQHGNSSLIIHAPKPELRTAANFLHMIRNDSVYSRLEERLLDLALVLHAEHGGGNNSSFTTHVVTSSGTDTYSAIAAAMCSLKGPRHGGANVDFYSGLLYGLLDIPHELYTPLFALARVVGWSAHRMEELANAGKSSAQRIRAWPPSAPISP